MWEYYQPIRPFKKGASRLACMFNKPILPMAFSYRKANFIRRILFKQPAVFTLSIGTLLFKDENLNKSEQELDLLKRSHDAVCYLANINPQENIYETIFHNSKRIDYYK